MSDEELKNQTRHHRESRDYWKEKDKSESKQYEKNAQRFEKELKNREWKRVEDQIQRENKREKLIDKKTKEIYKQMDKNPPSSSMNKARYLNKLRDQAFDEAYDEIKRTNPELFD
jgi:hypothetical protein